MTAIHQCDSWDARFFSLCTLVGSWSEDRSRQVGSVIVGSGNEIRGTGYNGLPRKVSTYHEARHSREDGEKYLWLEHAERNAIYNMARTGVSTLGCRMYVDNFPCADCSRAIIQSGIVQLNSFPPDMMDATFVRHYRVAETMLLEAGIDVRLFRREDALLSETKKRFLTTAERGLRSP
jgi:dCMP deaminase